MPPDQPVNGGNARAAEMLRTGRGVLLDFTGDAELRRTAEGWGDRVDTVAATPRDGQARTDALLVRPDGYVAWAAPGCGPPDAPLRRWFGSPRMASMPQLQTAGR